MRQWQPERLGSQKREQRRISAIYSLRFCRNRVTKNCWTSSLIDRGFLELQVTSRGDRTNTVVRGSGGLKVTVEWWHSPRMTETRSFTGTERITHYSTRMFPRVIRIKYIFQPASIRSSYAYTLVCLTCTGVGTPRKSYNKLYDLPHGPCQIQVRVSRTVVS